MEAPRWNCFVLAYVSSLRANEEFLGASVVALGRRAPQTAQNRQFLRTVLGRRLSLLVSCVPELATIRLMGHGSSETVRRVYAQLNDATYEDAIGCLPSVANRWQQNVIDFARASDNRTTQKAKRAENA